jgi:hypothetical protein
MHYIRIEVEWSDWVYLIGKDLKLTQLSRHRSDPQTPTVRAALNPATH